LTAYKPAHDKVDLMGGEKLERSVLFEMTLGAGLREEESSKRSRPERGPKRRYPLPLAEVAWC